MSVYISRYNTNLPEWYGAFIRWEIGETVQIRSHHGRPNLRGVVTSETRHHNDAPEIEGAAGTGRWVREIRREDTQEVEAFSEEQIVFA